MQKFVIFKKTQLYPLNKLKRSLLFRDELSPYLSFIYFYLTFGNDLNFKLLSTLQNMMFLNIPIYIQKNMTKFKLLIAFTLLLFNIATLEVGECIDRHSDGWSCLKCRDNYHLFEGKCYIDILGCTKYHNGAICQRCQPHYMLMNNLCCDQICLSKIFSTNKEGLYRRNYSDKSQALSIVMPFVQKGILIGSTYKLEAVQSKQLSNITRYQLLYHIISSYQGTYIAKRAIVDYDQQTKIPILVDWRKVETESQYSKVDKIEISNDQYLTILKLFPELYPKLQQASSYKIYQHNLTQVKEYRVLYYDTVESKVYLQVFYRNAGKITLLINEVDPIDNFRSYRKKYQTQEEVNQISKTNIFLQRAVKFVWSVQIMHQKGLKVVIEWANDPKITFFRFHAENSTHSVEIVIQYSTSNDKYNLVSEHCKKKEPVAPKHIDLPHSSSSIKQKNGQKLEKIDYKTNTKLIDDFLIRAEKYIKSTQRTDISTTKTLNTFDYDIVLCLLLKTKPKSITFLSNCKYTQITLQYLEDNHYIYLYFLQEKKTQKLNYGGYTKNKEQKDLSMKGDTQYDANQFQKIFGFKPNFAKQSVKVVQLRQNDIFRRKTITVQSDPKKLDNYYLYFSLENNQPNKLYSCVCRGQNKIKNKQSWTDSLGVQGVRSDDITAVIQKDQIAAEVLSFIRASNSQILTLDVIQIELDEYELILEYVISFGKKNNHAIAVVIHDKNDHTNSLISLDFLDNKEYQQYDHNDNTTLIQPERLPKEKITSTIVNAVLKQRYIQITNPTILGVIRQREAPSAERNILLVRDEQGVFQAIISITNINVDLNKINPYVEEVKVIQAKVVQDLTQVKQGQNPSKPSEDLLKEADEIESITSGVIYDGEVFQIEHNVKTQKLTPAIKSIIKFVSQKEGVEVLNGKLFNIQQHSDVVVTQFSLNYQEIDNSYTRYFVIKINEGNNLIYMGKDNVEENPQKNIYFKPTDPLVYENHQHEFNQIMHTIQTTESKKYSQKCKTKIWVTHYPQGQYHVVYLKDQKQAAAVYIIHQYNAYNVIKFIEGKAENLQQKIPTIKNEIQKDKQKYQTGLVISEIQVIKNQKPKQKDDKEKQKKQGQQSENESKQQKKKQHKQKSQDYKVSQSNTNNTSPSTPVPSNQTAPVPSDQTAPSAPVTPSQTVPSNTSAQTTPATPSQSYLDLALIYISKLPQSKSCSLTSYQQTKFSSGVSQNLTFTCLKNNVPSLCNSLISFSFNSIPIKQTFSGFDCKAISSPTVTSTSTSTTTTSPIIQTTNTSTPSTTQTVSTPSSKSNPPTTSTQSVFVPPTINLPTSSQSTQTLTPAEAGKNIQSKVQSIQPQLIDPNEAFEIQALQLILAVQQSHNSLTTITAQTNALDQIVIYLRASYVVLEQAAVIKISQDNSFTVNNVQRYVLYFFSPPEAGQNYTVYRAVVDYDQKTQQTKIMIQAFDKYIIDNTIVGKVSTTNTKLDIDIAYGYEKIELSQTSTDKNIQTIISQINTKYFSLVKSKVLDSVKLLQLKNGKLNYKITYTDSANHSTLKFVVYYDPIIRKVLVLNTVNLPASQQFSELSQSQKTNDDTLTQVLKLLNNIHQKEMIDYKLQSVSRGQINFTTKEYHISWSSLGKLYKSIVKSTSGVLTQLSFGQIQTISLDHYRLDQFEKMFILNYQKIAEGEYKTDTNFHLAYEALMNYNATLTKATLIGAAQKPLGLGYIYHIFSRLPTGEIIRSEVFLQLYILKATVKSITNENFVTSLLALNKDDTSVKKIIAVLQKQAKSPSLQGINYVILTVDSKDFLFGRLFVIKIGSNEKRLTAYLYHDHSSEQVMLLNWGPEGSPSGCAKQSQDTCTQCVQGYQKVNNLCVFGCGVICKNVIF